MTRDRPVDESGWPQGKGTHNYRFGARVDRVDPYLEQVVGRLLCLPLFLRLLQQEPHLDRRGGGRGVVGDEKVIRG